MTPTIPTDTAERLGEIRKDWGYMSVVQELLSHIQDLQQTVDRVNATCVALKGERAALKLEVADYKNELSSHICSAHMDPQPLLCDTCNMVTCLEDANDVKEARGDRWRKVADGLYLLAIGHSSYRDALADYITLTQEQASPTSSRENGGANE